MKIPSISMLAALLCTGPATAAEAPPPAQPTSYQQGVAAINAGDPAAAEAHFLKALQENPNNANARFQLLEVRKNKGAIAAKGREGKVSKVMIPSIVLDKATVQESFNLLANHIAKASNNEIAANFVVDDPKGAFNGKEITLKLGNVPAKAVIDYITSQTGAKARYDEHAIVIKPGS